MSENKTIGIIVGVGCGLALIVIVGVVLSKNAKSAAHEEKVTALSTQLRDLVSKADGHLRNRDFQGARTTLQAIEASIVNVGDYSLRDQYDQAMGKVASAERDYTAKVNDGWAVFEGRFISPAEKQKILADRERKRQEEAQRAERERQLAEERRQREAAEQQRREEQRKAKQNRRPSYEHKIGRLHLCLWPQCGP
jgi:flagellar biosynthesis GTPase FlhF